MTTGVGRARTATAPPPPPRFRRPPLSVWALGAVGTGLIVHAYLTGAALSPEQLFRGIGRLGEFLAQAFPPDFSNGDRLLRSMLTTFEMALIGTVAGVILSLPLAMLAARNTTPSGPIQAATRSLIALFRTVPDLIWGLIFVITVGLGPPAGILAITVDTIGFCGRFFADAIEEVEDGVMDGLRATGASRTGIVAAAVVPSCMPSFVGTTMFALEKSVRSSVVLGVVGAGGIGVELTTAMTLLRYDEACAIILMVLAVVLLVERISGHVRRHLL